MQLQENNYTSTCHNSIPNSPQMLSMRQSTASPLDIQSAQFAGTPILTGKKKVLSPRERILMGNSLQVSTVQSDKILQEKFAKDSKIGNVLQVSVRRPVQQVRRMQQYSNKKSINKKQFDEFAHSLQ